MKGWKSSGLASLIPIDSSLPNAWNSFQNLIKYCGYTPETKFKSVHYIKNSYLQEVFDSTIKLHEDALKTNPLLFKDRPWQNMGEPDGIVWREAIYNRFTQYSLQFPNNVGREAGLVVVPLVSGYTSKKAVESICSNGLKTVGGTDPGYFGKGIYFTSNIEYSKKYGKNLLISWVIAGNVYPVIEFPEPVCSPKFYVENIPNYQKPTLYAQPVKSHKKPNGQVTTYDTHYTVVRPFTDEGAPTTTPHYIPCELGTDFSMAFDEVVVFEGSHVIPIYLIEVE